MRIKARSYSSFTLNFSTWFLNIWHRDDFHISLISILSPVSYNAKQRDGWDMLVCSPCSCLCLHVFPTCSVAAHTLWQWPSWKVPVLSTRILQGPHQPLNFLPPHAWGHPYSFPPLIWGKWWKAGFFPISYFLPRLPAFQCNVNLQRPANTFPFGHDQFRVISIMLCPKETERPGVITVII